MRSGFRVVAASAIIVAAGLMIHADGQVPSQSADIQLRLGRMLFDQGQYPEALDAYRNAVTSEDSQIVRQARAGLIQSALRVAEFVSARTEANVLLKMAPRDPDVLALYADSLWASGLFEQAEDQYREALSLAPELARGRHGLARALLARTSRSSEVFSQVAPPPKNGREKFMPVRRRSLFFRDTTRPPTCSIRPEVSNHLKSESSY